MTSVSLNPALVRAMLGARESAQAKWHFGRLLLVCGSADMPGSAVLCALAAARSGAGLLCAASVHETLAALAVRAPECTQLRLPSGAHGEISARALPALLESAAKSSAAVFGCGLGITDETRALVRGFIANCACPIVIDADALNILSETPALLCERKSPTVLTPHIREFARLTGLSAEQIAQNSAKAAQHFAREYNVTLVLKGSDTFIAAPDGEVWLNSLDNTGLAKGGSGDALAGLIGGLLAQRLPPQNAACAGVYLHSQAGLRAKSALGEYAMRVEDVISQFPAAFSAIFTDK